MGILPSDATVEDYRRHLEEKHGVRPDASPRRMANERGVVRGPSDDRSSEPPSP